MPDQPITRRQAGQILGAAAASPRLAEAMSNFGAEREPVAAKYPI